MSVPTAPPQPGPRARIVELEADYGSPQFWSTPGAANVLSAIGSGGQSPLTAESPPRGWKVSGETGTW
jgi:hypothetical protein